MRHPPEACVRPNRRLPPVWLMGLSNTTLGMITGFAFFVVPQLLASDHVPEWKIAGITAVAMSPYFWCVLFGPMLGVRFSRRSYSTAWAASAAAFLNVSLLSVHHLALFEAALTLCVATEALSGAALAAGSPR